VISIIFWLCPKCTCKDFRRTGSRRLLDHAIEFGVRASEISLDSRAKWCKANLLSHLGSLFLRRSYQTRLYSDTSQGIRYIQLTFEIKMERYRGRAVHLWKLGYAFKPRFQMFQNADNLAKSTQAFQSALTCHDLNAYFRFLVRHTAVDNLAREES